MPSGFKGKVVLVTGATGFIGRHLVSALRDSGAIVHALVRDTSKINRLWPDGGIIGRVGDMERPDSLAYVCGGTEAVFHLASLAHPERGFSNDEEYERLTLEGTQSLLSAATNAGVKSFVYVSSVKAMGEGDEFCLAESSPTCPVTSYGRAKRATEESVLATGLKYDMHTCVLRLPLVYGHDNEGNIPKMIAAIDDGRFPSLPEVHNKRSMVHVDDVVQALLLTAEKGEARGKIYIATDGLAYSTRRIYELICLALGRSIRRRAVPLILWEAGAKTGDLIGRIRGRHFLFNSEVLDKLLGSAWYSSDKIRRELGFEPKRTLETALPEMVAEYRMRRKATKR